jgi:GT2 family glycosyltransferase
MTRSCCLMVLNYNGRRHLDDCFSSLLVAASRSRHDCRVVCVDNRSTEPDVAYLHENYPQVEVVVAERNDFLFSLNAVVEARAEEIVVILNNDMRFDPDFVDPLIEDMAEPDVFAVGARLLQWDGSAQQNAARRGWMERGWFYKRWATEVEGTSHTLEAPGGASAYRREMFVALGGFDPLYRPGYYEDFDLAYRAWARGWRSIYEPRSVIYHRESVTLTEVLGNGRRARVHLRNHLLFTAKNIGGAGFLAMFLVMLPVRALRPLFNGDRSAGRALVDALPRLHRALLARLRASSQNRLGTREVLQAVERPLPVSSFPAERADHAVVTSSGR